MQASFNQQKKACEASQASFVAKKMVCEAFGWRCLQLRPRFVAGHFADGDVSKAVATKDALRAQVEQVLSSLAKVLDANYPDEAEYKAQLRAAGFQREKYR